MDFACVDPDVRARYLERYLNKTLTDVERQAFDEHLEFCAACAETVGRTIEGSLHDQMLTWYRTVHTLRKGLRSPSSMPRYWGEPLPIHALHDVQQQDLLPYYDEKPLQERLAAAVTTAVQIAFPLTIEYGQGEIVGEFWKRAGHLWFRLQRGMVGEPSPRCVLRYLPPANPSAVQTFELQAGTERRLGPFHEFVTDDTMQAMIQALHHFQLTIGD